jgi:hypothetical protein
MFSVLQKKYFKLSLIILFFIEILSFLAWNFNLINTITFTLILIITLVLSLKKIEYGLYIVLTELFVSSQGYLFSLDLGGFNLSLRIGLFLVLMSVSLLNFFKSKNKIDFFQFKFNKTAFIFSLVLLWGFIWGIIRGNSFGNVFFDFNNWLFFFYIFPFLQIKDTQKFYQNTLSILSASVIIIFIKSIFYLYVFSHGFESLTPTLYKWIRDTHVGEVTPAGSGFYRIFIQSQIYSLVLFFVLLFHKAKNIFIQYILPILAVSIIFLSFSRSFWVGLAGGLFFYFFLLILKKIKFKEFSKQFGKIFLIFIISFALIWSILVLPPQGTGKDFISLIGDRAGKSEAASNSRLSQLQPLFSEIINYPIIGSGFGTTVTYLSSDPRITSSTAGSSGEYTTYAFEWGYFDMWLKFGLFGLLIYLALIFQIFKQLFIKKEFGLLIALISILIVNVFSPYLNHPLGIGFILFAFAVSQNKAK